MPLNPFRSRSWRSPTEVLAHREYGDDQAALPMTLPILWPVYAGPLTITALGRDAK